MSIFQKLGLTTNDGEAAEETSVQKPVSKVARPFVAAQPVAIPTNFGVPGVSFGATPDADIVNTLNTAAAASQVPGYDQFCVNRDALQGLPDIQRYAMALNLTNANHGLGPDKIVASLDDRIALVQKEQTDFEAVLTQNIETEVTARQTEADALAAAIETAKQEIQAKEAQRVTLLQDAANAQMALDQQKLVFKASVDVVIGSLNSEREKIAVHIPKVTK